MHMLQKKKKKKACEIMCVCRANILYSEISRHIGETHAYAEEKPYILRCVYSVKNL